MNDTMITIVGNVVDEPKLRETKSGVKVLSFRIASTSRRYDREQERWVDNESLFATVTCWRWLAENVAASLHKGQPVIATGKLYTREYRID
jgi:single-strand DNA-binding protein